MNGRAVIAAASPPAIGSASGLAAWLVLGVVGGLAGSVAMDAAMHRQPDGWTPAFVAAAVLRRSRLDRVDFRDALIVHHVAGGLAGVLYGIVGHSAALLLGPGSAVSILLAHLLGVVVVVAFIYAFFAHLVLPRGATDIYEERATAVRGQWLRSSLVFGAVLLASGVIVIAVG